MSCPDCERLRAEVRHYLMRERLGLTPSEARILAKLYERSPAPVAAENLLAAAHRRAHAYIRVSNLIRVHICRLRMLLGKDIRTDEGKYALTAQGKAALDEMLA